MHARLSGKCADTDARGTFGQRLSKVDTRISILETMSQTRPKSAGKNLNLQAAIVSTSNILPGSVTIAGWEQQRSPWPGYS